MASFPCSRCGGPVTENSGVCPRCGLANASSLGTCYRCTEAASSRCADCGRFFCPRHGGMDWAKYPACNQCRAGRRVLLLVILPLVMVAFAVALTLLYFLRR